VHGAARIAALAGGDEILASAQTAAAAGMPQSAPRMADLKGLPEPVEIVSIDWR
jgi:class 3 adenylate cyclase